MVIVCRGFLTGKIVENMKKEEITEITDKYWNNWSYQESSGNFVIAEDMFDEMVESLVKKSSDIHNVSGLFDAKLMNRIRASKTDAEARRLIMSAINKR